MIRFLASLLLIAASALAAQAQDKPFAQPPGTPPMPKGKGYKPLTPEKRAKFHVERHAVNGPRMAMLAMNQTLPPAFDCRAKGWVPPVGDQGQCGSCYLYSTIYGTLSSCFIRAGYGKADGSFIMSVQYGMDCHNFGGCNGGNGTEVIDWVMNNGWPAESWVDLDGTVHKDYPAYQARSASCRKVAGAKYWKPANWGFAAQANRAATTDEIKTALYNYGPLNVSLDAGGQFGNGAGTITALGTSIDHEIELVSWDDNKDGGAFLLKNQWNLDWGNGGYRWCTYKACANLVDVFWVTATPPPTPPGPPVPPVPPGPVPPPTPNGATLDLSATLAAGKYKVVPHDSIVIHGGMTLKELADAIDRAKMGGKPCCDTPSLSDPAEQRLRNLEASVQAIPSIVRTLEKIETLLTGKK